ncbi:hypothetical protein [Vagococcus sp.]|uniref:hypothetical protein n=1 Tax=Vagococcus sp. TaxID=1933889 RepID=UPI003F9B58D4
MSSTVVNDTNLSVSDTNRKSFSIENKGEGKIEILAASDEEASETPVVYLDKEESPIILRVKISEVNPNKISYFYIDGELIEKIKVEDDVQTFELTELEESLKLGNHLVQLVQYKSNDEQSEILIFKQAEYEVKSTSAENRDF